VIGDWASYQSPITNHQHMKILHTADWHLGQKFLAKDRIEEHRLALEWLYNTINDQNIDVLLIAGDIFDIGNPPNYARQMYYKFLTSLQSTKCRHVVIIGGNHDSPSMINAPKELLQILNVHVVGAATDDIQDEIIVLENNDKETELVVAAVPFLRDRDLRTSVAGETGLERIAKIREGIVQHFQKAGEVVEEYASFPIPIIAMGHLYAKGASATDKQNNIYIGDVANIEAAQFPTIFKYIALGHLHRTQMVQKQEHIRYSGSLIPVNFGEILDKKSINILEWDKDQLKNIETVKIPRFRNLIAIEGSLEKVQERLEKINENQKGILIPWVEITVVLEETIPHLDATIREFSKDFRLEILKIRAIKKQQALESLTNFVTLDDLSPLEVFEKKCDSEGTMVVAEREAMLHTFRELQNWMNDREDKD